MARPSYTYDSSEHDLVDQFKQTANELSCLGNFRIASQSDTSSGFMLKVRGYKLGPFVFLIEESDSYVKLPSPTADFPAENNYCFITVRREGYADVIVNESPVRYQGSRLEFGLAGAAKKTLISKHKSITVYFSPSVFDGMEAIIHKLADNGGGDSLSPLLAQFLNSVADILPIAETCDLEHIQTATKDIIGSSMICSTVANELNEAKIMSNRLEFAKSYIRSNLRSPDLDPLVIGNMLNVSRRQLFKIFEPVGGVANYIRNTRLDAAWQEIIRTGGVRSIKSIAEEFGFSDASTFSKQFKAKFSCSPASLRDRVRQVPRAPASQLMGLF